MTPSPMTRFLDVRAAAVGGGLADSVSVAEATSIGDYVRLVGDSWRTAIQGRHVLVATHGFNVNRQAGIACLHDWEGLLDLGPHAAFMGLLWPGDSIWAHGLDYPDEPRIANAAGLKVAAFLDATFADAASISFASHSLGARVVLEAVAAMTLPVRRTVLMAGAIDDDCLTGEFAKAARRIERISALSSRSDWVLKWAFPLGNLFAGVLTVGHPWWHGALGRSGPTAPRPTNFQAPFQIPDGWNFGHGDYLHLDSAHPVIPAPVDVPPEGAARPAAAATGWTETWSAALTSTRFH